MKRFITLLLFSIFSTYVYSQKAKIDSLDRLISKATTDTGRINLLVKKINLVRNENIDSSILLCKKILLEAQAIRYYKGEINVRSNLVTSYCFKGDYKLAEENLEFLKAFIKPFKDSSDYADLFGNYGMMYGMQSKYATSIQFYEKSIGINERSNNTATLASNYSNIAIGFQQISNFDRALFYQQKALKLAEDLKNESTQAYTLVNMGGTYDFIRDSARAEQAYLKSVILAQKNNLKNVELYAYTNLATHFMKQSRWEEGYKFAIKAAALGNKMGDQGIHAASLSKAAVCLANTGNYSEAIEIGRQAISIADSSGQPMNIYQGYSSMGNVLQLQKKYSDAISFYEKGFAALNQSDMYEGEMGNVNKDLSECYEQTGNYNKALAAYKKYALINDSVRSKANIQKTTELSMNYEFKKKQEIADALQGKKNAEARSKQYLLLVGLGVTLILAIGAWIAFRNKQRAHHLLQLQKEEIQVTLTQLKTTQAQLIQSEKMASLGELTAGIAHEIQNPLNFVNNFSEINTELIDELRNELNSGNKEAAIAIANSIEENEQKIIHHGKRADAIVKGMLQHSRSSTGQKEPTDINALTEEYLRLSYHGFRAKDKTFNAAIQTNFDGSIEKIKVVPQDLARVLLNLFTNAFYAVAEKKKASLSSGTPGYQPTISISTKVVKDAKVNGALVMQVSIKDNGTGITQKALDKIFQPFFTTKPTGEGTGLGLSLSYDVIKAHGGEIKVKTKEGEGTEFIVELPVY